MRTTEIKCDNCEADVTYTGNSVDYRIVLGSESKSPWYEREGKSGGAVTDMMIYDPFPKTRHFCSTTCLAVWVAKQNNRSWRSWLAEKSAKPQR